MTRRRKLSFRALVIMFLVISCGPTQPQLLQPTQLSTSTITPMLEPIPTLIPISTVVPTRTIVPTRTFVPLPVLTTTATQLPDETPFFRRITSLPNIKLDTYSHVQVRALADGSVWIITNQSVLRWNTQAWEEILSGSEDMLAAVDDNGRLWVLGQATSTITAWQDGQWMTYAADSGWMDAGLPPMEGWTLTPWSFYSGVEGKLWVPMANDVRAFEDERWTSYSLDDMGFAPMEMEDIGIVHSISVAKDGTEVWVGECYYSGPGPMGGGGVRWFDGTTWHGADLPVGSSCVSAIQQDSAEDVWLGTYEIIWRFESSTQSWTEYPLPESLLLDYNFAYAQQLIIDQNGDLWAIMQMCGGASCGGSSNLYRLHDGEWSLIIDAQSWSVPLMQLALDGSGQGWLFGDGKVYQLEAEFINQVASMDARGVGVDPDGRIWVLAGSENNVALWLLEPQGEE